MDFLIFGTPTPVNAAAVFSFINVMHFKLYIQFYHVDDLPPHDVVVDHVEVPLVRNGVKSL